MAAGQVITDPASPYSLAAEVGSNNTGELTAMAELFLWLLQQQPSVGTVVIFFDSTYAANICTGTFQVKGNSHLAYRARNLRRLVEQRYSLIWQWTKAHSSNNHPLNYLADMYANKGRSQAFPLG